MTPKPAVVRAAWSAIYDLLSNVAGDAEIKEEAERRGLDPEDFHAAFEDAIETIRRRARNQKGRDR